MDEANANSPGVIDFATASRVTGGDRHFTAEVHPSWDGPLTTHGGLLQAIALNVIEAAINSDGAFQPRSITCHYLRPPTHGSVDIFVDPQRRGRRFASTRATMSQGGKPCISVLATHSNRELSEIDSWQLEAPAVAPPPSRSAEKVTPEDFIAGRQDAWIELPAEAPAFFQRMLFSARFGHGIFRGPPVEPAKGTSNGGWIMSETPHPIDAAWVAFVVDALWPSVLEPMRQPTMAPTLDLTTHFRGQIPKQGLPDQPLLVHNRTRALLGGLADSDSWVFTADGTLLAQARQLQLVAPIEV